MNQADDRLFQLLPAVYRARDEERGWPLRTLLRVVASQVDVLEDDIRQLYDNWFIETCEDWVVPYIGDLVGYQQVHEAGQPADGQDAGIGRILIPRRDVADTIANRRRKGTLAVLQRLAADSAGWSARAVEFYRLLDWTQNLDHLQPARGRTADLRNANKLDRLGGPFDEFAHTVDVRRISSRRGAGRYNIPSVGAFVWRLGSYPLDRAQARRVNRDRNGYTFSPFGNDAPLFARVEPLSGAGSAVSEHNVPAAIRLRALEIRGADGEPSVNPDYYGDARSLQILVGDEPVDAARIVPADLSEWTPPAGPDEVAVDPKRGRIVFGRRPDGQVRVSYHYGFSADMGGGEYLRNVHSPSGATHFLVGEQFRNDAPGGYDRIQKAIDAAWSAKVAEAVIEITDSATYREALTLRIRHDSGVQIRAASGCRPVIRIEDDDQDMLVALAASSRFALDGVALEGGRLYIQREPAKHRPVLQPDQRPKVVIRHCTLVPGWKLDHACCPLRGDDPSLVLDNSTARVDIDHSIVGTIHIKEDEVRTDPLPVRILDSIVDATTLDLEAISAVFEADGVVRKAHAVLTVARSTVFGGVHVHSIDLAENAIFMSVVRVARSQVGCVRFCYVTPASRTPRRYRCQPDLAEANATAADAPHEILRVRPAFTSVRYGEPAYCQLACDGPLEISGGAGDESEMGAFHDLFQPQRAANLRARLDEFTPAGMDAGLIYVT